MSSSGGIATVPANRISVSIRQTPSPDSRKPISVRWRETRRANCSWESRSIRCTRRRFSANRAATWDLWSRPRPRRRCLRPGGFFKNGTQTASDPFRGRRNRHVDVARHGDGLVVPVLPAAPQSVPVAARSGPTARGAAGSQVPTRSPPSWIRKAARIGGSGAPRRDTAGATARCWRGAPFSTRRPWLARARRPLSQAEQTCFGVRPNANRAP
jgi:hypothetical protein